jgi:hypothetical protein
MVLALSLRAIHEMIMQSNLFICEAIATEKDRFTEFWASQYSYKLEHLYETNISIRPFTDDAIRNLFEWKNGSKLAKKKQQSVERNYIYAKEHAIVRRAMQFVPTNSTDAAAGLAGRNS